MLLLSATILFLLTCSTTTNPRYQPIAHVHSSTANIQDYIEDELDQAATLLETLASTHYVERRGHPAYYTVEHNVSEGIETTSGSAAAEFPH